MTSAATVSDYSAADSNYLHANPDWHVEDSPWKATQILKMFERNKLAPKSIVEIGCGAGEILNQLHERLTDKSIEFSGFEISPDAISLAKTREKDRLHYYHQDLLETGNKYDLLLMIDVFEHVPDYIGFINKSKEKATYKIYHIPMDISVFGIMINNFKKLRKSVGHIHYFNEETAVAPLRDSGQEIVDWFYTRGALEIDNKGLSFTGKIVNFMRRIAFKISPDRAANTFGGFSLLVLTK
jgi:SAM-dependent methyltransferase